VHARMTPMSLEKVVAPRTGKFIKNGLRVFERRKKANLQKSRYKGLRT